jgi:hypothetical protein
MCSLHEAHYMMAKSVSSPKQLTLAHSVVNHDSSVNTVIRPWAEGQVLHMKAGGGFFLSASVIRFFESLTLEQAHSTHRSRATCCP